MALRRFCRFIILVVFAFAAAAVSVAADAAKASPFVLSASAGSDGARLTWTIAPGDYLYRDKIVVRTPDGARLKVDLPAGEVKDDPNFGSTEVYHNNLTALVPNDALNGATRLDVVYQGCAERGICYPPVTAHADLITGNVTVADAARSGPQIDWPTPPAADDSAAPTSGGSDLLPSMTQAWLPLLLTFAGFGLLLAFTPCVLPMVPIVAGMLTRAGTPSPMGGFALAGIYTLAMAGAYALLGVVAAWSGQNLQAVLQTPAALAVMAAIYVALALSSFGLFELQLPASFGDSLTRRVAGGAGPLLGAAALGFTSALIVGPCVTPPLAAALLYVAQTGDAARGAGALFALGLGMGAPLVLVGTFGGGILPRSGPWLIAVRKAFGVVFLGVAIVLIGRVLPGTFTLLLWAALAIGAAVFVGAFDRLAAASGAVRRLGKAAGLALFIYGAALIVGAAGGADDPMRPLAVFFGGNAPPASAAAIKTVTSLPVLDKAIAQARRAGRPIMIDYSADWCTACKTMERDVFAAPGVQRQLAGVTQLRVDVTATNQDSTALMKRFDVVGPPTVVFLRAQSGDEISAARIVGETSADAFAQTLQRVGASS